MRAAPSGPPRFARWQYLEQLEPPHAGAWDAGGLDCLPVRQQLAQPGAALIVGGPAGLALEDRFADSAVGRQLNGEPDAQSVFGSGVMAFVDAAVHGQPERPGFGRGLESGGFRGDIHPGRIIPLPVCRGASSSSSEASTAIAGCLAPQRSSSRYRCIDCFYRWRRTY